MKTLLACLSLITTLAACGNPGGISDTSYKEYKELGAPKILYSCSIGSPDSQALINCRSSDLAAEKACSKELFGKGENPIVTVHTIAGVGVNATYNKILGEAKMGCSGKIEVLDSKS
jgi:hypothetical protein